MDLRTPLAKVKGHGSAKNASHHWWMQRLSALALIPLVIWFVCTLTRSVAAPDGIIHFLYSPFHALAMILFICTMLYHGTLGMKVVYEDYIHCPCGRTFMIIATNFISIVAAAAVVLAVLYFHVGGQVTAKDMGYHDRQPTPQDQSLFENPAPLEQAPGLDQDQGQDQDDDDSPDAPVKEEGQGIQSQRL